MLTGIRDKNQGRYGCSVKGKTESKCDEKFRVKKCYEDYEFANDNDEPLY